VSITSTLPIYEAKCVRMSVAEPLIILLSTLGPGVSGMQRSILALRHARMSRIGRVSPFFSAYLRTYEGAIAKAWADGTDREKDAWP